MLTIKRVPDYEKEIARLRAANKKLRAELAGAKEQTRECQRYIDRLCAEGETLERVVEMFARAIGGKAK